VLKGADAWAVRLARLRFLEDRVVEAKVAIRAREKLFISRVRMVDTLVHSYEMRRGTPEEEGARQALLGAQELALAAEASIRAEVVEMKAWQRLHVMLP
jgi:nucleotide-binding universal stress UspA family protein